MTVIMPAAEAARTPIVRIPPEPGRAPARTPNSPAAFRNGSGSGL